MVTRFYWTNTSITNIIFIHQLYIYFVYSILIDKFVYFSIPSFADGLLGLTPLVDRFQSFAAQANKRAAG